MADESTNSREEQAAEPEFHPRQDEDIRGKVRELASQALKGGQMDPRGVEEVVRTVTDGMGRPAEPSPAETRQALLNDLQAVSERLSASSDAAQAALARIASRGSDFTENDLKEALAAFRDMQFAYAETVSRVADVASGNIQRELRALAGQGPLLGLETGARAATVMTEFANRMAVVSREGAASGIGAAKDYGARMSMLASGVLAGIADALHEPPADDKKE